MCCTITALLIFRISFYMNFIGIYIYIYTGQLIQSVFGHHNTVICLDYDQDRGLCSNNEDGLVVSGSCDCTVMLWKWSGQKCRIITPMTESMKSNL